MARTQSQAPSVRGDAGYSDIPLNIIEPSRTNPRKKFDVSALNDLAENIRSIGVIQPIVVRPREGDGAPYEIVAGERRWRACGIAGLQRIPAIIRHLDDKAVLEIQVIENLQREDIHPLEESAAYHQLCETHGYTPELLADKAGKSTAYIYQRLKLGSLVKEAQALFADGQIQLGHGLLLARLPEDHQYAAMKGGLFERNWNGGRPVAERTVVAVAELNGWIHREILSDLKHARFSTKDAGLVPAAGACTACPKRSGANTLLFPEQASSKTDHCLDRSCFDAKIEAAIAAKVESGKAVAVTSNYNDKSGKPRLNSVPRTDQKWDKKCDLAVAGIVVDGRDKGETVKICLDKSCKIHYGSRGSTGRNKEEADRQKAAKLETKFRKAVHARLREKLGDTSEFGSAFFYGAPLVAIARAVYDRLEHTERQEIEARLFPQPDQETDEELFGSGRLRKRFEAYEDEPLMALVVEMAAMRNLRANAYGGDAEAEELNAIAKAFDVDVDAIRVEIKGGKPAAAKTPKKKQQAKKVAKKGRAA